MAVYAINTDRNAIDEDSTLKGVSTCDLWFKHEMAFAGDFLEKKKGKHASLFMKLKIEDVLLMYHSGKGYVGIGKVISEWDEKIYEGEKMILYTKDVAYEYRIPVLWTHDFRERPLTEKNDGWPSHARGKWKNIVLEDYPKLDSYVQPAPAVSLSDHEQKFKQSIAASLQDSNDVREKRLANAQALPRRLTVVTIVYERNPDVVAKVLKRAEGTCELCRQPAPFNRKRDGSPYLEVHHIKQLSLGGSDIVSNAQALCPNCHRKAHYGIE